MSEYLDRANKYVKGVLNGKIPSCEMAILACKRYVADLERRKWPFKLDPAAGSAACEFVEQFHHVKGKWAKEKSTIHLEGWQCFFQMNLFGWMEPSTGFRRFREADLYVPRKNAKSIIAAADGLYMLTADGEAGAEVYCGATSEKQAWEVFRPARLMALKEEDFQEEMGLTVNARSLTTEDGSRFEPVIGKPGDGASPSLGIIDEFHEHETAILFDTFITGMGAREQPIALKTSTAGNSLSVPCYDHWRALENILRGILHDERRFGMIFQADPKDDWTSKDAIIKSNPNLDISVFSSFLYHEQDKAKDDSRRQNSFQTKHLNRWVNAGDPFINMQRWKESENSKLRIEDFRGQNCIIAFDLSSKIDLTAIIILFPPQNGRREWVVFGKYYLPEKTVWEPENEHYQKWSKEGKITVTPGSLIDYELVLADLLDYATWLELRVMPYDPHQSVMLVNKLMAEGLPCIEYRQSVLNFSEPMKQIEGLVLERRIAHNGDEVLAWFMSNVEAQEDAKRNVFPRRSQNNRKRKIDGFVALVMAMGCAMNLEGQEDEDLDGFLKNPIIIG